MFDHKNMVQLYVNLDLCLLNAVHNDQLVYHHVHDVAVVNEVVTEKKFIMKKFSLKKKLKFFFFCFAHRHPFPAWPTSSSQKM